MASHSDTMLRAAEVMARVGLSRTTIWRRVRAGTFPAPVELGVNSIGWRGGHGAAHAGARLEIGQRLERAGGAVDQGQAVGSGLAGLSIWLMLNVGTDITHAPKLARPHH